MFAAHNSFFTAATRGVPTVLNVSIVEAGNTSNGAFSFTRSHDNPTNTNRLFVWLMSGANIPISSVTYDSVTMTLIDRFSSSEGAGGTRFVAAYSLMNPASGNNSVTVTSSDAQSARIEGFFVSVSQAASANGNIVTRSEWDFPGPYVSNVTVQAQSSGGEQLFMVGTRWRNSAANIVPASTTQTTVDTQGLNDQNSRASLTYFNSTDSSELAEITWGSDNGGITMMGFAVPGSG